MDEYLSVIKLIAAQGSFAVPRGWALCDGKILSIAQNNALFALLNR
ncbi:MAG: tail fiber protein [Candidatus Methylumidiphilus sp.]